MRAKISRHLLLAALISLAVAYGADYASVRYKMADARAGEAFGTVTFYVATPLKNTRVEVFYDLSACRRPRVSQTRACLAAAELIRSILNTATAVFLTALLAEEAQPAAKALRLG
jgi:hypothetical protein